MKHNAMYILYHDDKKIMESESDWAIVEYIYRNHSYSISHAVRYEGYQIYEDGKNISEKYI